MKADDAGDAKNARELWEGLAKLKDEPLRSVPSEKRALGVLAEKRLKAWDEVEDLEKRFKKNVTVKGFAKDYKPPDTEEKAAKLFLDELKQRDKEKDKPAAERDYTDIRDAWRSFQRKFDRDRPDERKWWLMAAKRLRDLPEGKKAG